MVQQVGKVLAINGSNVTISANWLSKDHSDVHLITLPVHRRTDLDVAAENIGSAVFFVVTDGHLALKQFVSDDEKKQVSQ